MKKWMNSRAKLGVVFFAATAVASCGAGAEAASGGFLTEVPAGDWSYEAVNELISAGAVPEYEVQIPAGRVMSRLEMAMIVDSALQNEASLEPAQGEILGRLKREYYYDMKKLALLNRLDSMDASAVESAASTQPVSSKELEDSLPFTKADKEKQDKMASFLDRFQISGRARIRNDHRIRENGGKKTRETVSNHINVWVDTAYKVNNNWKILTGLEYRNSMGSLKPEDIGPTVSEVDSKTPNPYLTLEGKFKNGFSVKVGKWYEWTPNGYGFDLDSDVVGGQVSFGKKLRTTISAVKFDLADYDEILALPYYTNVMPYLRANNKYANGTDGANFFGIRFDYPINQKNDIHFGVSWMSALPTQFQDPTVNKRNMYYYIHGHHVFDKNWQVRAGIMHSNAKSIPNGVVDIATGEAKNASKVPGLWLGVQYKAIDLQKPGTYDLWATYRREPGLTMPTVTDWWEPNKEGYRIGFDYVLDKNLTFTTWMNWFKDIDTSERTRRFRFQVDAFF
ncbi:MAG: hypothetical protein J6O13_12605 [Selenomonas sp.]|nr:hypothetical protein [Selenomonas sp.]